MKRDDPYDPQLASAVQAHEQGRLSKAERLYKEVLDRHPSQSLALLNLGFLYEQTSRVAEAVDNYRLAIEVDPNDSTRFQTLGNALMSLVRVSEAVEAYAAAARLANSAVAYHQLGVALLRNREAESALKAFRTAQNLDPSYRGLERDLARALMNLGQAGQAIETLQAATRFRPESGPHWLDLGEALLSVRHYNEALEALRKGLRLAPDDREGRLALAETLIGLGNVEESLKSLQQVLAKDPSHLRALFLLALAYQSSKANDKAVATYRRVLDLEPSLDEARSNLAMILAEQGHIDEAATQYAAVGGRLRTASKIRRALLMPIVPDSNSVIDERRNELRQRLAELKDERVEDPQSQIGAPGFFLAYQGRDNRDLLSEIADVMQSVVPDLLWTAPALKKRGEGKRSVGFLSRHLHEHTVGRINVGLIEQLDREQFEVVVLRPPSVRDELSIRIDRSADRVVELSGDFRKAREKVAAENLDVLYFPDLGMDPFTYYLAFARMAPVQCVGWGHADTSGIPAVDYFVSCRAFESIGAEQRYSERLVCLSRINNYFETPNEAFQSLSRADLGLPQEGHLYLCPQSSFKLHPDFDEALDGILARDPSGIVAISAGAESHWDELLRARFARTIPERNARIVIIPRVPPEKFRGLLALPDVIIDPKHFTGGHTTYMAFSVGTPVVTWEGEPLRARMTAGLYDLMGVSGPIAKDNESFVEFACSLANDPVQRTRLSEQIVMNRSRIFEDLEAVREFEHFLLDAAAGRLAST